MRTWDLPVLERVGRSPDARDESGLHAFATLPFTVFARATSILSRLALPLALLGYLAVSLSATETLAQVAVPFTQNKPLPEFPLERGDLHSRPLDTPGTSDDDRNGRP